MLIESHIGISCLHERGVWVREVIGILYQKIKC